MNLFQSGLVEAIALDCVVKSQNAKHDLGFFYDCFKSDIVVVGNDEYDDGMEIEIFLKIFNISKVTGITE